MIFCSIGPGSQKLLLMSDVGGGADAVNTNLTFDDTAAGMAPTVVPGTFRPSNNLAGDLFPAPAPPGPYPDPQLLSAFIGRIPMGCGACSWLTTSLILAQETINGGWRLNITTLASGLLQFALYAERAVQHRREQ